MIHGRVVIIHDGQIALIRRERDGQVYFILPGGGAEPGETPERAAEREAHEELGLHVRCERLLMIDRFEGDEHHWFLAIPLGGTFGSGTGPEYADDGAEYEGTHHPVWVGIDELPQLDVRPWLLAEALVNGDILRSRDVRTDRGAEYASESSTDG